MGVDASLLLGPEVDSQVLSQVGVHLVSPLDLAQQRLPRHLGDVDLDLFPLLQHRLTPLSSYRHSAYLLHHHLEPSFPLPRLQSLYLRTQY